MEVQSGIQDILRRISLLKIEKDNSEFEERQEREKHKNLEREFRTLRTMVLEVANKPTIEQENEELRNSINELKAVRIQAEGEASTLR